MLVDHQMMILKCLIHFLNIGVERDSMQLLEIDR